MKRLSLAQIVITPTGRLARVIKFSLDGLSVDLRYNERPEWQPLMKSGERKCIVTCDGAQEVRLPIKLLKTLREARGSACGKAEI